MKRFLLIALLLLGATWIVFQEVPKQDFVLWDDNVNVYQNPHYNPVTPESVLFFWQHPYNGTHRPLTHTVWAALASVARLPAPVSTGAGTYTLNPQVFHVANLILHCLNVLLLFIILRALVRDDWASGAGAMLFAIHPVQVEPVAWVTGMNDVLATFFSLLALWQYLVYAGIAQRIKLKSSSAQNGAVVLLPEYSPRALRVLHYGLAITAFALALLCKPAVVTVPLIAWVLDRWAMGRSQRQCTLAVVPWLALAVPIALLSPSEAPPASGIVAFWLRPFVAGDALAFYMGKLLLPLQLVPDYGRSPALVLSHSWGFLTWIVPCAIAVALYCTRKRWPDLTLTGMVFVIALLPVLGLIPFRFQSYSTVADRYLYLAMIGPAWALASVLAHFNKRQSATAPRKAAGVLCVIALALLAFQSTLQTLHWYNSFSLFEHTLEINPNSWVAHHDLGLSSENTGKLGQASVHYLQALQLNPQSALTHVNLAGVLTKMGKFDAAIVHYRGALQITPESAAHYGLGVVFNKQGKFPQAVAEWRQAIRLQPNYADVYNEMGVAMAQHGQMSAALTCFRQAIRLQPDAATYTNYGATLLLMGQKNEAKAQWSQALRLDPNYTRAKAALKMTQAQHSSG